MAKFSTLDGNEAVASVAYRLSEVVAIYPITPASAMGEFSDDWAASKRMNLWGVVPDVVEMQSEAGAAGAVHGALQAGSLATTFTASQGLLLMLPNLYKIAGELTGCAIHVAARAVATQALSIFGDHSDVMAARSTGMALLCSGSVQEAQDLAAIAHATALESRVPFLHFFDGFRTSHEVQKIVALDDEELLALIDPASIEAHRARRLTPEAPVLRGTSQNPDAFFPAREASNPFYDECPDKLAAVMERFAKITGRAYRPFEYTGHPEPERVIVMMGSGAECTQEVVESLVARGERVGLLRVRLFRPFSMRYFFDALPASTRAIAVLDRAKEPGASADPLALEVGGALLWAHTKTTLQRMPKVLAGRYGLGSREFTPPMAKAVFDELARAIEGDADAKVRFTVGVRDDVTRLSLAEDREFSVEDESVVRAVFYGLGSDGTVSSNKASLKILGEDGDRFVQGHFVYDSKKSGTTTVSHLRFGARPIRSTYEIQRAKFVAVHDPGLLDRRDVLSRADQGATVLLNLPGDAASAWDRLPREAQSALVEKRCELYVIDANRVAEEAGLGKRINTVMQVCFFALSGVLPRDEAIAKIKESVAKTWGKRGPEVVRRNVAAIDACLDHLVRVEVGATVTATKVRREAVPSSAPDFVQKTTRLLLEGRGDELPVSAFPPDGTWPVGTAKYEKRSLAADIPVWESDLCIQCNKCSMICPHSAIRTNVFEPDALADKPEHFASIPCKIGEKINGLAYVVQVAPDDCTGCGLCVEVCPAKDKRQPRRKAINMVDVALHRDRERERWAYFSSRPEVARSRIPSDARGSVMLPTLFEFSGACSGCGETPYIRWLTQLFGDRMLIANATGCSSIYGGNLPTTPYTTDAHGRGPAWNNSLFEDAAEFGLGFRLAVDALSRNARALLSELRGSLPDALVTELEAPCFASDELAIERRRAAVLALRAALAGHTDSRARLLFALADELVPRAVWVIGGDGWAYDIGYGGLDHVIASGRDVKLLVLDTEVYSNTGGQQSKATPLGAAAKFASAGKESRKKDLGLLAMSYGHVYVASIALQAKPAHAADTLREAMSFHGPALVIAHSPCIAHGYDLVHSPEQQRRAVDSWAWPLFRFDPRRIAEGKAPLEIDSGPPKVPLRKYMEEEARFRMVELRDPARYETLVKLAEDAVSDRRALYSQLAGVTIPSHEIKGNGGAHG
ncbi:MAG: pyruvate:ferredoxin (flavodoxin) oxidoreductase [Myxococcales bacterium]|nr:pyruvate:ferredoxin (flavodoxin) oxidoreductase [Myxococcales bacterium]